MELLTWGAIIAAGSSVIAVVKFWMDLGAALQAAKQAAEAAAMSAAQVSLLTSKLADFKVEVAQTYVTTKALDATEAAFSDGLNKATQGIYSRLDAMTTRLDSLLTLARREQ